MLDDVNDIEIDKDKELNECDDKDKQRLLVRRRIEERLEEKRLKEEIFDDFYSYND